MRRVALLLPVVALAFAVGLALVLGAATLAEARPRTRAELAFELDTALVRRATIIASDELPDAALAVYDAQSPRIYLHRRLLAQMGPALSAFLLAHEQGHLAYHHARQRGFGLQATPMPASKLREYEFVADCYAVRTLQRDNPAAVVAAVRFFQRRRNLPGDAEHPPMGERADSLLACLARTRP